MRLNRVSRFVFPKYFLLPISALIPTRVGSHSSSRVNPSIYIIWYVCVCACVCVCVCVCLYIYIYIYIYILRERERERWINPSTPNPPVLFRSATSLRSTANWARTRGSFTTRTTSATCSASDSRRTTGSFASTEPRVYALAYACVYMGPFLFSC